MIGYKRIVTTLGERLGKLKLVPAQGGSAELAAAAVIGVAGFTGFPVSTTHVVTGGVPRNDGGIGCRATAGDGMADRCRMGAYPSGHDLACGRPVLSFVVTGVSPRGRFRAWSTTGEL